MCIRDRVGWHGRIAQVNYTKTIKKGTIRGFHFQHPPYAEHKYIKCTKGKVYDVALDLRKDSPTFLSTYPQILSQDNCISFLLPPGVAHGFQALTDDVELLYLHSEPYNSDFDDGVNPLDPLLNIDWPYQEISLSKKDNNREFIKESFRGIEI